MMEEQQNNEIPYLDPLYVVFGNIPQEIRQEYGGAKKCFTALESLLKDAGVRVDPRQNEGVQTNSIDIALPVFPTADNILTVQAICKQFDIILDLEPYESTIGPISINELDLERLVEYREKNNITDFMTTGIYALEHLLLSRFKEKVQIKDHQSGLFVSVYSPVIEEQVKAVIKEYSEKEKPQFMHKVIDFFSRKVKKSSKL